jgi:FMN reductase
VITAGLSEPSSSRLLADHLAAATEAALARHGQQAEMEVIELREHAHEITNTLLTGVPTGGLPQLLEQVSQADAVIAVSPIFNASYSGLFKSFIDTLDADALVGKPVLIAATGGTERHSLALDHALRPLFAYLHALTAPTAVYAASTDWGAPSDSEQSLHERVERAAGELATLLNGRQLDTASDPFETPTPFEQLLGGR